jgi:hypothetical protein
MLHPYRRLTHLVQAGRDHKGTGLKTRHYSGVLDTCFARIYAEF